MKKTKDFGKVLENKLKLVDKQVAHWGLEPYKFKNIPAYEAALLGWQKTFMLRFDAATFESDLPYAEKLGRKFIEPFIRHEETPLVANLDTIQAAAKNEDDDFFVALAILLVRREQNELLGNSLIFGPKTYPELMWFLWIRGLLWLMTDNAVLQFLNGVFGQTFTLGGHREARKRSGLARHPDTPIIKISWPVISDGRSTTGSVSDKTFCTPILKSGWVISDGIITHL